GDEPLCLEIVASVRRVDGDSHVLGRLSDADDLVPPAQLDEAGEVAAALHQILLDIILLEVDEGRHLMAGLGQASEGKDLAITMIEAPDFPGDALLDHSLADAKPIENLERAFGPADCTGADGDDVVVVEHDARDAVERQVDRHGEADGSGTDD